MAKRQEMAKTGESPKKPLKNSKRPILKTGRYECCETEWFKNGITLGQKLECRKCNKEIGPKNQITWNKRWYGYFGCTEKGCKSTWVSSNTWTVDNKIQTTQCRKCKTSVLPYEIRPLEKNDKEKQFKAPHKGDLCSMCKQLGFPCTELESNDKEEEQIDNHHAQFNKLLSSLKRMNVKSDYRTIGAGDFGAVLTSARRSRAVY